MTTLNPCVTTVYKEGFALKSLKSLAETSTHEVSGMEYNYRSTWFKTMPSGKDSGTLSKVKKNIVDWFV